MVFVLATGGDNEIVIMVFRSEASFNHLLILEEGFKIEALACTSPYHNLETELIIYWNQLLGEDERIKLSNCNFEYQLHSFLPVTTTIAII